jgi:hypothetical protein
MANTIPIPVAMREEIALDVFMKVCIYVGEEHGAPNHDCDGRVEWEHSSYYAGRRINEPWAVVPCCTSHNRGEGIVKEYNQYRALLRAIELLPDGLNDLMRRYPKFNWIQRFNYLNNKYGIDTA